MMDDSGSSKGFGFIHFETEDAANTAIAKVNGMLLNGKKVYVGKFIPQREREKQLSEKVRFFTNIYVKNLGNTDREGLHALFRDFGRITSCAVMRHPDGASRGFGFVAFERFEDAERAVGEMHGKDLDNGYVLYVARAQKKAERHYQLRRRYERMKQERFQRLQGVNLFVKNLDDNVDDEMLKKEFSAFGKITSAKVSCNAKLFRVNV